MISLSSKDNQIAVTVMGQFTLDDYREFEQAVGYGIQFQGTVNLLFDCATCRTASTWHGRS
jgi:hypothetical protein